MSAPASAAPMREGQIVSHTRKVDWGPGRILRLQGDQALVFFVNAGQHNGATRNPLSVLTSFLKPAAVQTHRHLDNLPPLGNADSVTRGEAYVSMQHGRELFLHRYPAGFADAGYLREERDYKGEAHKVCRRLLARDALDGLLVSRDHQEIVRRALHVVGKVNLPTPWDHMALRDGLAAEVDQGRFADSLRDLLHGGGPEEARFTAFARMLAGLPQKQARVLTWPNQTILWFLWDPRRHMFMKPGVTQQAANRRAFDLRYKPEPNWETYNQLLELTALLFEDLADLGPRDNIDVQSFIWKIGER